MKANYARSVLLPWKKRKKKVVLSSFQTYSSIPCGIYISILIRRKSNLCNMLEKRTLISSISINYTTGMAVLYRLYIQNFGEASNKILPNSVLKYRQRSDYFTCYSNVTWMHLLLLIKIL